jgi:hypothetical protein
LTYLLEHHRVEDSAPSFHRVFSTQPKENLGIDANFEQYSDESLRLYRQISVVKKLDRPKCIEPITKHGGKYSYLGASRVGR